VVEEQELAWDGGQELELGLTNTASATVSVGSAARPTVVATVSLPAMSLQAAKVIQVLFTEKHFKFVSQ
jgi:hypothetical protein